MRTDRENKLGSVVLLIAKIKENIYCRDRLLCAMFFDGPYVSLPHKHFYRAYLTNPFLLSKGSRSQVFCRIALMKHCVNTCA